MINSLALFPSFKTKKKVEFHILQRCSMNLGEGLLRKLFILLWINPCLNSFQLFFLILNCSSFVQKKSIQVGSWILLTWPCKSLIAFLLSRMTKYCRFILYISYPWPEMAHFFKEFFHFSERWYLETTTWALGVFIAT